MKKKIASGAKFVIEACNNRNITGRRPFDYARQWPENKISTIYSIQVSTSADKKDSQKTVRLVQWMIESSTTATNKIDIQILIVNISTTDVFFTENSFNSIVYQP